MYLRSGVTGQLSYDESTTFRFQETTYNRIFVQTINGKTKQTASSGTYTYEAPILKIESYPAVEIVGDVFTLFDCTYVRER